MAQIIVNLMKEYIAPHVSVVELLPDSCAFLLVSGEDSTVMNLEDCLY